MTKKLEKKIQIFLGLHRAWERLRKILDEIDNLPSDIEDAESIDEISKSETFKTYEQIDKALNQCDDSLSIYYDEICESFEKMSPSELKEFGMTYWNEFLADPLFELLTDGTAPESDDEKLEFFKSKTAQVC